MPKTPGWIAALAALALWAPPCLCQARSGPDAPDAAEGRPPARGLAAAEAARRAPLEPSAEAAALGRAASAAELCGMDEPPLIARQAGAQLSASLWTRGSPFQVRADLAAFNQGYRAARLGYLAMDDAARSRECAFGWLQWRSVRSASRLGASFSDLGKSEKFVAETASIHGWAWACMADPGQAASRGAQISRQAASALLFSALASDGPADLALAQRVWISGFDGAFSDPKLTSQDCADIDEALPGLAASFAGRAQVESALDAARKARLRLLGNPG